MKKIQSVSELFFALVLFAMIAPAALASTVVNLNAATNSGSNPINLLLQAGAYLVDPIGVSDGGTYNAWNAWGSTSCLDPSGCVQTIPTQRTGWLTRYGVSSLNLSAVSVRGVELSPISNGPATNFNSYFYDTPTLKLFEAYEGKVFPNDITALANALSSTFTVNNDGNVSFYIGDSASFDNLGGMSLRVSSAVVPIPAAVWLFGSSLACLFVFRSRKR